MKRLRFVVKIIQNAIIRRRIWV